VGIFSKILGRDKTEEKGVYNLPITGGTLDDGGLWNWWQSGRNITSSTGPVATVHACVSAYAETIASLPGQHFRYAADGSKEPVRNSALSRVLHQPNDYQTRSDFMLNLTRNLLFDGNAYVLGRRNSRNEFSALHMLPSQQTMPYIDPDTQSVFYSVGDNPMVGNIEVMIPARDIMHIRLFTPRHPLIGVSPIENAAASIAANAAISSQQAAFFTNSSRPSGVLSTEQKLNRDQMQQLRQAWEQQSQGMNAGQIPILSSGIKWEQMGISNTDSAAIDSFNLTIADIARAMRVPLAMIQHHDGGSTYSNVEQLYSHWLAGGLGFMLEHIELSFDKFFGLPREQKTELNVQSLLRTDFIGKVDGYSKLVQGGLMTVNEGRAKVDGLQPVENGDTAMTQAQMVPLGWTEQQAKIEADKPEPAPAPAPVQEPDPEEAKGAVIYSIRKAMKA